MVDHMMAHCSSSGMISGAIGLCPHQEVIRPTPSALRTIWVPCGAILDRSPNQEVCSDERAHVSKSLSSKKTAESILYSNTLFQGFMQDTQNNHLSSSVVTQLLCLFFHASGPMLVPMINVLNSSQNEV